MKARRDPPATSSGSERDERTCTALWGDMSPEGPFCFVGDRRPLPRPGSLATPGFRATFRALVKRGVPEAATRAPADVAGGRRDNGSLAHTRRTHPKSERESAPPRKAPWRRWRLGGSASLKKMKALNAYHFAILPQLACWRTGTTSGRSRKLLGHTDVNTTMIYTHVLNRRWGGARSQADRLAAFAAPSALGLPADGRPLMLPAGLDNMASGATALPARPPQQRGDRRSGEIGARPDKADQPAGPK